MKIHQMKPIYLQKEIKLSIQIENLAQISRKSRRLKFQCYAPYASSMCRVFVEWIFHSLTIRSFFSLCSFFFVSL